VRAIPDAETYGKPPTLRNTGSLAQPVAPRNRGILRSAESIAPQENRRGKLVATGTSHGDASDVKRMIAILRQPRTDFDKQPMIGTTAARGPHEFVASRVIARSARAVDLGAGPGHGVSALIHRVARSVANPLSIKANIDLWRRT
jgi:hypothetical protein